MDKKKKYLLIIGGILIGIVTLILTSYAYWLVTKNQTNENIAGSGCLDITLTDTAGINLTQQFPITDAEGMNTTPYTVTIENVCTMNASYELNMEVLENTTLGYENIKTAVNNDIALFNTYNDAEPSLNNAISSKTLKTGSLAAEETISLNIRLWLDENSLLESSQDKVFQSKVVITFVPDTTGNTPTDPPDPIVMGKLEINNKTDLVGILYSTWFNPVINDYGNNQYNISEILAGNGSFGPENTFHYWAKPALGYYRSDDESVIRSHLTSLSAAGVDFIIVDNTNTTLAWYGTTYWDQMINEPMTALLDTMLEMREEGLETPYVVTWNRTSGVDAGEWMVTKLIYNLFYKQTQYADLFVYWDDKPFFLTTEDMSTLNPAGNDFPMTWRKMWGLQPTLATYEWSYLQTDNTKGGKTSSGTYEQMGVSVAMQQAYMSNTNTIYPNAIGRNYGITWYNQWSNAFTYRPKIITVTWWNEWIAQRLYANSRYNFTDNYNQEYSRDIEPMTGGHGNKYYNWLVEYIRAYKAHETVPRLVDAGH